jgi:UDP-glucose 4-epimerase
MIKKPLITGSSGTIGTRLCEKLLEKEQAITCVDIKENQWNSEINKHALNVDLRKQEEVLGRLPSDVDSIIHLAANARVPHAIKQPSLARDNFEVTFNILEFARLKDIKKFIFISSKDVYGNLKTEFSETDVRIEACESPYAASKIGGEALIRAYYKCFGIDFLILRIPNVYGMYDEPDRLIPILVRLADKGKKLTINGKEKLLDFVHVDDVADGIILAAEKFDEVKNDDFNIGYGEGTLLMKIAELVKKELNSRSDIIIGESNPGDVVKSVLNISKAKKELGYVPKIDIETGITKAVTWCLENDKTGEQEAE